MRIGKGVTVVVKIDLTVKRDTLAHNIRKAKENRILIPTIDQMMHPEHTPEKVREGLKKTGSGSPGRMKRRRAADCIVMSRTMLSFPLRLPE